MIGTELHAPMIGLMDDITFVGLYLHKATVCVAIEDTIRGQPAGQRLRVRLEHTAPLMADLRAARGLAAVRWTRNLGQELKLSSPWLEDGPDDGQAEAVFG